MKQFDKIKATFKPKRTKDLRPSSIKYIGKQGTFEAYWIIEEGRYKGQWAMFCNKFKRLGWVPLEDLIKRK